LLALGYTHPQPNFSRDVENLSPNLSPCRREALNSPPSGLSKNNFAICSRGTALPILCKSQNVIVAVPLQMMDLFLDAPFPTREGGWGVRFRVGFST